MLAQSTTALPGVRFLSTPGTVVDALPRMDVAALVGFAACGPLHVPVMVEDAAQFRDVFGDDLPLAWNGERHALQYSLLGPSVELFFRNGGRRCWVVRVAQPADGSQGAQTQTFRIPGLYNADALSTPERLKARAPGAWADPLRVDARLHSRPLGAATLETAESPVRYTLRLVAGPTVPVHGDLIELRTSDSGLRLYLFAQTVVTERGAWLLQATQAYWFEEPAGGELLPLSEPLGLASWGASGSPAPDLRARLLRMELRVWDGDRLQAQLGELGFAPDHPRYWGALPDDETLYRRILELEDGALGQDLPALWADAGQAPRFPLAGTNARTRSLPLGMSTDSTVADALPGDFDLGAGTPGTDGLATLSADLFLDPDLGGQRSATLLSEAKHKQFVRNEPLRGIHSLMTIEEVALLSIPDAGHRQWNRQPHLAALPLPAPWLDPAGPLDVRGRRVLSWSPVAGAMRYEVQQSDSPAFDNPTSYRVDPPDPLELAAPSALPAAPPATLLVRVEEQCPSVVYFRVRTIGRSQTSVWSNTQVLRIPQGGFHDCAHADLETLGLRLHTQASTTPGSRHYTWEPLSPAGLDARVEGFELQCGHDADFLVGLTSYPVAGTSAELPLAPDARTYYRVRAVVPGDEAPWSNTLVVDPLALSADSLVPVEDYDARDLLAVHCAVTRLCGVRADCLGLLGLPAHYRSRTVSEHLDALLPAAGESTVFGSGTVRVHCLGLDEETALSHVALFHPWVLHPRNGSGEVAALPPDGAVLGTAAARSLARGAWISPANEPLTEVLGLTPTLDETALPTLLQRQVNLLRGEPRGYLLAQADTLSLTEELRPLSVRRFMHLLHRLALREGTRYVFESNGTDFHDAVRVQWQQLLLDLYVRGALRGVRPEYAFRVVVDPTGDAVRNPDLGRLVVELQVAPSRPLRFINVRLIQAGSAGLAVQEV